MWATGGWSLGFSRLKPGLQLCQCPFGTVSKSFLSYPSLPQKFDRSTIGSFLRKPFRDRLPTCPLFASRYGWQSNEYGRRYSPGQTDPIGTTSLCAADPAVGKPNAERSRQTIGWLVLRSDRPRIPLPGERHCIRNREGRIGGPEDHGYLRLDGNAKPFPPPC